MGWGPASPPQAPRNCACRPGNFGVLGGQKHRFHTEKATVNCNLQLSIRSVAAPPVTKTLKNERALPTLMRRPVRTSPTVPPRPVPWLPMAMADLTGAVGIASRRARARASLSPPPAGDVGKRKQLRRLFVRPQLFLAMPTLHHSIAARRSMPAVRLLSFEACL